MHQVFIEGGLIRKLWGVERTPIATICSGSTLKVVITVSVAQSPTA